MDGGKVEEVVTAISYCRPGCCQISSYTTPVRSWLPATGWRLGVWLLGVWLLGDLAQAQIVAPTFGTRGAVDEALLSDFMRLLRGEIGRQTGLLVSDGDLVTAGLAGSLEPEFAYFSAQLYGMRYALSGELSQTGGARAPYTVSLLVADSETQRSTDVFIEPLTPGDLQGVVARLAERVARFVSPTTRLEVGSAGLFVSSTPGEASLFINGVEVGETSALDVIMLKPGSYLLELRKEGFLPASRMIVLSEGETELVNVALTTIAGGSIQIFSTPSAEILLDGEPVGVTPLTVEASPGARQVTLQRPGFQTSTFNVPVQNYRVSRLDEALTPIFERMLYWDGAEGGLFYLDGTIRTGGFIGNPVVGEHLVELRRSSGVTRFSVVVPETGAFEIDFEGERLEPLNGS